jgi:hypothetical protein
VRAEEFYMPNQLKRSTRKFTAQATELAFATPQVVNKRVAQMIFAGPLPSVDDRKEFKLMSDEKIEAFKESWAAMATETVLAQQRLAIGMTTSMLKAAWFPWVASTPSDLFATQMGSATMGVLNKGLEPVRKRAVANARRLSRVV